jgi:hypothetical protein
MILHIVVIFMRSIVMVEGVQAKQGRDRWQKFDADWTGYGYDKVSPNGIVYE